MTAALLEPGGLGPGVGRVEDGRVEVAQRAHEPVGRLLRRGRAGDLGELPLHPALVLHQPAAGRAVQHVVPGALGRLLER